MKLLSKIVGLILLCLFLVNSIAFASEKTLIIYYSRTGNTKAVCESLSKEINADIVEVKDLNNRMSKTGIIGGMFKTILGMRTKIFPEKIDMSAYPNVILSSPIWATKVAPAMRTVIYMNGFKDKNVIMLVTCDSTYAEKHQNKTSKLVEASSGKVSAFYQVHAMEEQGKEKVERGKDKMIEEAMNLSTEIKKKLVLK